MLELARGNLRRFEFIGSCGEVNNLIGRLSAAPYPPLPRRSLARRAACHAKVLDVGLGPVSRLGPYHRGVRLSITAVDPLAPFYDEIAKRYGVIWPVKTVQGFAEGLSAQFPANHFDLVYCSNALDHSMDPVRGIVEMLVVAKIGGRVTLEHQANEAENENYSGFYQWNFDEENGAFIVWKRQQRIVVNEVVAPYATLVARRDGATVSASLHKTAQSPLDVPARHRLRVQTLLAAFTLSSRLA